MAIKVTVWNEFRHEKNSEEVKAVYPNGMHTVIAEYLGKEADFDLKTATLDEPEHGLTDDVLNNTDVLIWWGHMAHGDVQDTIVEKVKRRVLEDGMGLIVLHSGHFSKIFQALMGTTCALSWREAAEKERLWSVMPQHPILEGIPLYFELEHEEMYGEFFDIPTPDELIMLSWFKGGDVFRSAACWVKGAGKVFYFRPGHESYPTFYNENVLKVIKNGVRYVNAPAGMSKIDHRNAAAPIEEL